MNHSDAGLATAVCLNVSRHLSEQMKYHLQLGQGTHRARFWWQGVQHRSKRAFENVVGNSSEIIVAQSELK